MKIQFLLSLLCSASPLHAAGLTKTALAEVLAREDIAGIRAAVADGLRTLGDKAGVPEVADKYAPVPKDARWLTQAEVQPGFSMHFDKLESMRRWRIGADPTKLSQPLRAPASVLSGNVAAARVKLDGDGRSLVLAKDAAGFLMWAQERAGAGLYPFPAARGTSSDRAMEVATAFLTKAERAGQLDSVVRNGWAYDDLGDGGLQFDNAECGVAMFELYEFAHDESVLASARKAADWAAGRPLAANWNYNSFSVWLLAKAHAVTGDSSYLAAARKNALLGVMTKDKAMETLLLVAQVFAADQAFLEESRSTAALAPSSPLGEPITLLAYRNAEWYASTFWTGPDWTRVGKNWHHPGENNPSVRRFTAPHDGSVTVAGRVFKLHLDGDGIRASIRHNDREVWQAEIDGNDDKGVEPNLALDVKKGDALRFIVHKRGAIACDTTGWDPVVAYADGQRFQASVAFAAKKQGEGGWFYEMLGNGEVPQPDKPPVPAPAELKAELTRLAPTHAPQTDLDLLLLALEEWWREDNLTDTADAYAPAVANHLRRARDLAADLGKTPESLEKLSSTKPTALTEWRTLYLHVHLLKRELALSHPLLDFDKLLFSQRAQPSYSHLVGQYFGWRQRPGGGLFVLENLGRSLAARNIVGSQLPAGSYLEPRLSYDGRRVVFSFVACPPEPPISTALPVNEQGDESGYYHIYEINVDGTGLRQLTRGPYDDMMPCVLPDGGIAFVSTRRRSYSRCFGPNFSQRWHSYTLHRMNSDGSGLRILSVNDVSEWFPSVANSGEILFARWDYIDRDAVTHQNLWSARPDGSNPIAVWGNATPKPHCTFQAKAIPGSRKIAFIASAHHAVTGGPVCVLDPAVDPNSQDAITRLTPGPYPEAESSRVTEYYESPWPLSEKHFLVAYSRDRLIFEGEHGMNPNPDNALGLYLLDAAGNRELLYRDAKLGGTCPIPLKPQPTPPVLPSALAAAAPPTGEMLVTDIYQGLGDVPRGTIKELRVIQIFPKTTWLANSPQIGIAGEENTRAILGTVPIEADGSARFLVPAHKPVLFQALDKDGFAYQTMRSTTYVQPGETTSCIGCHEQRMSAPTKTLAVPLAMQRPPSRLEPGELGGRPFSFVEVVQPVLNQHCVKCHSGPDAKKGFVLTGEPLNGFTRSYLSLTEDPPPKQPKQTTATPLVPRYAQRNQIQTTLAGGEHGALGSRLMTMLRAGHEKTKLSAADLRRLAAWIDCNAIFHGSYDPAEQVRQQAGERLAMPEIQ